MRKIEAFITDMKGFLMERCSEFQPSHEGSG
jgi:hypothetical protein